MFEMKPVLHKLVELDIQPLVVMLSQHDAYMYNGKAMCLAARVLPEGVFSPNEIEELREYDQMFVKEGSGHFIANFLPDEIRPEGVPKM